MWKTIAKLLDGKKTYLVAAAMGLAAVLLSLGKITHEQFDWFQLVAIPAGLAALRDAIRKT
jgi:4-hydroxybenzoate polyprenyltransferase